MKLISTILLAISLLSPRPVKAADEPMPFDKFLKKSMKVIPGTFPVYQDGARYFLEIASGDLNSDILVVGDIARGYANEVSQSSGVIRFSIGSNNNLNITKQIYQEAVSADLNPGMEKLVQESNLIPVSSVIHIEAQGKAKGSYIIDVTKQLMEGGDLFSFKDFSGLSRSDVNRSGVQGVKAMADGVVFSVLRTQTDTRQQSERSKVEEKANAYILSLVIQRLPQHKMQVREADPRIGFATVTYNDFGKNPYGVREVNVIKKWDLTVQKADLPKYRSGSLAEPAEPIQVFIDQATPDVYMPYLKQAVQEWNSAFAAAGFKNVFKINTNEDGSWLSSHKILIKWGNVHEQVSKNLLEDPRTGEILAAKMNISDLIADALMPAYFVACGLKDQRVIKSMNNPQLKGEILRWKAMQALGELLGLKPNLYASNAYTTTQIRSAGFLKKNSFTSSVTDDSQFNYAVQPDDQVPLSGLIPGISAYDRMAINWAYRIFPDQKALKAFESNISYDDAALRYVEANKDDPFTQPGNLASNQLDAVELGMKNIQALYPRLDKITGDMVGHDEDYADFVAIANAFQSAYNDYTKSLFMLIGGQSNRPVIRGYNEVPVVYVSKNEQQKAFDLMNTYLFSGVPDWMNNPRLRKSNSPPVENKFQRQVEIALSRLVSPVVIGNLIKAENANGNTEFTVQDLFNNLDHYIFKDFDATRPVDAYTRTLQATFVYNLAQAVNKDSFMAGLTDTNEVLHLYFVKTMNNINKLAETHTDAITRANYQLMKMKIEKEYLQK
ncbi:zinc-dependent metalloprotease [Mucilaginibacter paludis]|uniref:DUF5117 domain-containing protein n=1 Tax=Mucilaginibacter paludis DSM 18603 TaxID=714943 RepID=H1Y339_9SPHI|nr:zinc-dependent metalloprotease [Mucilaginibacter paludis]EHQ28857.1 hypothetical protein Mucpa_4772 [Mucilaginibacter paludis DSM 18603]